MGKQILTKEQINFLKIIGENKFFQNFYLTGGTPLAAFYLHHRYSEDLDFFSEDEIDVAAINVFMKSQKKYIKFKKIDFRQTYNRNLFYLQFPSGILKTEFTYFPFSRIEKGPAKYGVTVDSLIDIAVNKLFTIYQRTNARDYVDLYLICKTKKIAVGELIKKAKSKFDWHIDPLQLGSQFIKAREASDLPHMIRKLPEKKWRDFFMKEAKKMRPQILE